MYFNVEESQPAELFAFITDSLGTLFKNESFSFDWIYFDICESSHGSLKQSKDEVTSMSCGPVVWGENTTSP